MAYAVMACIVTAWKVPSVLLFVLFWFVWVFINNILCENIDSLDTFLAFAQMANVPYLYRAYLYRPYLYRP